MDPGWTPDGPKRFNPRPRVGGDSPSISNPAAASRFQSTPPRGGRRRSPWHRKRRIRFQSTPPRGGATPDVRYSGEPMLFQSTPPRGGRLRRSLRKALESVFQSTPPRGGRRHGTGPGKTGSTVSIHAPAWGATPRPPCLWADCPGFNPRPRVGGDVYLDQLVTSYQEFQSTPPRGGATILTREIESAIDVSIHAPAWGATPSNSAAASSGDGFNPRPPRGGRR